MYKHLNERFFKLQSILSLGIVADCAVVGKEDSLKGHIPLALCVLKKGKLSLSSLFGPWMIKVNAELTIWTFSLDINTTEEQVLEEIVKHVRQTIGPVAAFRKAVFVKQLPKTRSGKIPRSTLSALVNGKPYKVNYQGRLVLGSEMFSPISLVSTKLFKWFSIMNYIPKKYIIVLLFFLMLRSRLHSHSLYRNDGFGGNIKIIFFDYKNQYVKYFIF